MCGFCGSASLESGQDFVPGHAAEMNRVLSHRGPDDEGILEDGAVSLGFRRLSIIDLSDAGHQPMANASKDVWIVFNGEVYNFKTLRRELEGRGHQFASATDTEVVLHAYEEFGEACVDRLEGMFAFAIWDRPKQRILLARDRMGVKPIYYTHQHGTLAFASEAKALLSQGDMPSISQTGLVNYFTFGHGVSPDTIYSTVQKLPPGHLATYDSNGLRVKQWWRTPRQLKGAPDAGVAAYAERTRTLLRDSVADCLVGDVPVGVFLSGGIDSGAIVGIMARDLGIRPCTFSLGFDCGPQFNELEQARVVSRHFDTDHHELLATQEDLIAGLEKLAWHFDEPFADPAAVPVYILAEFARRHVKVVLTGEGGDELFGGYRRTSAERFAPLFRYVPSAIRSVIRDASRSGFRRQPRLRTLMQVLTVEDGPSRMAAWHSVFDEQQLKALLQDAWAGSITEPALRGRYRDIYDITESSVENKLYSDLVRYLPDTFLEKTDKSTMAASLEARVPFLERRLVEFAASIPAKHKLGNPSKRILRHAVRDLLPAEILARGKQGFAVPLVRWFGLIANYAEDTLLARNSGIGMFLRRGRIEELLRDYRTGDEQNGEYLWSLLSFELWYKAYYRTSGRA